MTLITLLDEFPCLIFDFDGVLVESVQIKTEAFEHLYSDYGAKILANVLEHHEANGGMSRFEKIRFYHETYLGITISSDEVTKLSRIFSEFVIDKVISCPAVDGAIEVLDLARKNGNCCSIASATPQVELLDILEGRGWLNYFSIVCGSPRSKSDSLRAILRQQGIGSNRAIFFGDSPNDLHAAKTCDIKFVPINYLGHNSIGFRGLIDGISD